MTHSITRRGLILLCLMGIASATAAQTSDYPSKPIRLVVGFSAGGAADTVGRALAESLSQRLGQPVVVENLAGANGNIAADAVARAKPDGHTLYMPSIGHAVNPSLYRKLNHDPIRDFSTIGLVFSAPNVLVVPANSPYRSLNELIADARANPGKLSFASAGNGTSVHLSAELLKRMAKIDAVHVPYRGTGSAMPDLIAGVVQFSFPNLPSALPQVKAGKLRALGVTTESRSAAAPDIPTIAEAGVPGYRISTWYGLVAPAGLPADIRTRLNRELQSILNEPKFRDRLLSQGADPMPGSADDFARFLAAETERWRVLIEQAKISLE